MTNIAFCQIKETAFHNTAITKYLYYVKKFYTYECINLLETLLNISCLLAQALVCCFVRRHPLQPLQLFMLLLFLFPQMLLAGFFTLNQGYYYQNSTILPTRMR